MPVLGWVLLAVFAFVWASYGVARVRYRGLATGVLTYPGVAAQGVILYLPGILARGHESLLGLDDREQGGLLQLLRSHARQVQVLEYDTEQSNNDAVTYRVVQELRHMLSIVREQRITIVAASKGAMIVQNAMARFSKADRKYIKLVLIDPPSGSKDMGLGGNFGAPIARWLRALLPIGHGMLLGSASAPSGAPRADETQADLDFAVVNSTAVRRLEGFPFRVWWGDLAWMDKFRLTPANLADFGGGVHYIVCTLGNVTVKQPQAVNAHKTACPSMHVHHAAMPHCGWLQQPNEARAAIGAALAAPWN